MADTAGERVAYFNGRIVPEREVRIPFRDRGFKYGDAVFDTTRTFGHRIFRLQEHLERLYRSLRYLRIDPGLGIQDLRRITEEVLQKNLPLLEPDDDYWVTQRVTRGLDPSDRARLRAVGADRDRRVPAAAAPRAGPALPRRHPRRRALREAGGPGQPQCADEDEQLPERRPWRPRGQVPRSRGLGDPPRRQRQPRRGNREQRVPRPRRRDLHAARAVRPSRHQPRDGDAAGARARLAVHERDVDLFDAYNADEAFLTSTSLCVCPVRSFNGVELGRGQVPGPVTRRVIEAYCRMVDYDFVAQYLKRLER